MTGARWAPLMLVVSAAACGTGDPSADAGVASDGIVVVEAWTRPSPATVTDAALYVTLEHTAGPDDEIVAVASERCVTVVPHLTSFDDDGVATMTAVGESLRLPEGGSIEMGPNGLHLMCLGIDAPFVAGDVFELDVGLAARGPVTVEVLVEDR